MKEFESPGIKWDGAQLHLLDQTRLPGEMIYFSVEDLDTAVAAIKELKVRGAPAIGVAAAYSLYAILAKETYKNSEEFFSAAGRIGAVLKESRPTAVNLTWAVDRMLKKINQEQSIPEILTSLRNEAESIHREDKDLCSRIGLNGIGLIKPGINIITHCNAGSLATSGIGTATAPMYTAHKKGIPFRVFCDETRPLLQGARLTAWELSRAGIEAVLICDNMAASLMAGGNADLVIVGTDRVAANGDAANKIGTLGLAVLARHFGIPFYVACPGSTVDLSLATGKEIPIEERDGLEVRGFGGVLTAPESIDTWNPAFDVTPHELITGIITEKEIVYPPFKERLKYLYE